MLHLKLDGKINEIGQKAKKNIFFQKGQKILKWDNYNLPFYISNIQSDEISLCIFLRCLWPELTLLEIPGDEPHRGTVPR